MAVVETHSWKRIVYGKGDYDNGKYVAVSSDLGDNWTLTVGHIATSTDGENWTKLALGELSGLNAVAYGNNTFIVVGNNGYILASMYGGDWKITRITTIIGGSESYPSIQDVAFGSGKFVAVSAGNISTSVYGNSWTTKNVPINGSISWNAVAYGNGKFVAIASTGYVTTYLLQSAIMVISPCLWMEVLGQLLSRWVRPHGMMSFIARHIHCRWR